MSIREKARRLHLTDEFGMSGFGLTVAMIAAICALVAVIAAIAIPVEIASCHQAAERVGRVTGHYRFPTGCYYRLPSGREVPQDRYPPKWIRLSR